MICKKCKRKLQVRRTTAEKKEVLRERYCPKCEEILSTLELPLVEMQRVQTEWQERVDKMTELYEETKTELESTKETVKDFFILAKKISK